MKKFYAIILFASICTMANAQDTFQKTYGGNEGASVRQTSDGGFIATGYAASNGGDVYLMRTDSNGDSLWTNMFGGTSNEHGYSVEQTSDGGFIVAGHTLSFGAGD